MAASASSAGSSSTSTACMRSPWDIVVDASSPSMESPWEIALNDLHRSLGGTNVIHPLHDTSANNHALATRFLAIFNAIPDETDEQKATKSVHAKYSLFPISTTFANSSDDTFAAYTTPIFIGFISGHLDL